MKINRAAISISTLLIVITSLIPLASFAIDEFSVQEIYIGGVDRCTWEPKRPGQLLSRPDMQSLSSCREYASDNGWAFTGSGDEAWVFAHQEPNTVCRCGQTTEKWFYYPAFDTYKCNGISYSCTKPGSGCVWHPAGTVTIEADSSPECRSEALTKGAYYGWQGKQAASIKPDGSCECSESKTHWYSEMNATTDWQFTCSAFKYRCLARQKRIDILNNIMKKKFNPE